MSFPDVPEYDFDTRSGYDFHSVATIQLCELYDCGWFDLTDDSWNFPKYNNAQHERLCAKILEHYYYRELALTPPGVWKREFLRKMNEIMPKYIVLYKAIDEAPQLIGAKSEYFKSRNIYSEFPQTMLSGNSDYASSGNDNEYERIYQLDILDLAERIRSYDDVDLMIIEDIESLFSCFFTIGINAF